MASTKFLAICYMFLQGIFYQSDAAPVWTSSATGTIAEDIAAETEIIKLVATTATSYTIKSTNPAGVSAWFVLVNTDRLRIATGQTVDYEHASLSGDPRTVTITITASDGTDAVDQDFELTITDVNEAPVFSSADGFSNAFATVAAGDTIVTTDASDQDTGATLTYALTVGTDPHVEIGAGGVVTVKTGQTLADCVKFGGVKVTDSVNEVKSYFAVCIGACDKSCDGCSGAGAVAGNIIGVLTAFGVLVILYEHFH